jgi:hypothetical protein
MNHSKNWHTLLKRGENLPIYCKLILAVCILILSITIGFSLGIMMNKNKYQMIQKQIENQQMQEEVKLDNFLKNNRKK